jgi:nickel-type superoxide dismutase maturation protease
MFPIARFRISDASMEPGLQAGDYVLVNRWAYRSRSPNVGDIVVLRHPRENALHIVKRVSAVPGPRDIFVVGDNSNVSEDSRMFGPVDRNLIVGRVWLRLKR